MKAQIKNKTDFIYCFSYFNPVLPSVRYRAVYPLAYLKENFGIGYFHVYPQYNRKAIFTFLKAYLSALLFRKKNSVIIFQRIYTRGMYALLLKILALVRTHRTYYDTDDAEHLMRNPDTINFFLKKCYGGIVGSSELKSWAEKTNTNVSLLTSPVIYHQQVKKRKSDIFTIGWIGCFGRDHKNALYQLCFPAIHRLGFSFELVILGVTNANDKTEIEDYFKNKQNVDLEVPLDTDWMNEESVYSEISRFDIGLAPLIDNEIHRSKSAFKLKQYFSCGVPGLSNRVGENAVFLKHNVNGLFCNTIEEFQEAIFRFYKMTDQEYALFSECARNGVPQFNLQEYGTELVNILNE